jgi:membrane-bound serine protease (ClpP class)
MTPTTLLDLSSFAEGGGPAFDERGRPAFPLSHPTQNARHPERSVAESKDPETSQIPHTTQPQTRVPHVRDGFIVANVGIEQSSTVFLTSPQPFRNHPSHFQNSRHPERSVAQYFARYAVEGPPHFAFALALAFVFALLTSTAPAQTVLKLTLHDTIQPITADYLARGLRDAQSQHAAAVVIALGTPGGLLESTRLIVSDIEASPVPVIVYISPTGSRAGSAGFFLLESADIAAMAPGTNAGASHPVIEGPSGGTVTQDPIMKQKLENDTAAFLRSFTSRRGRNVAAAEDAVRNSKSYSDTEALDLHLIDLIAPDDPALLHQLDGRTIHRFDGTSTVLHLQSAVIVNDPPSLRERLLTRLADPNLAVLLIVAGGLLIYLEFNVPGTIVPGALGTLCVLLGAFGLNLLPVRHAAVAFLLAALVLIVLEAKFTSHGILATAGVACLVFGLATLVDGPIPEQRVHISTALAAGIGFGAISFFLAWIALRARRSKQLLGPQALLRQTAVAITPLAPTGQVEVRGELWQARLANSDSHAAIGASLTVRAIDGLVLLVDPASGN